MRTRASLPHGSIPLALLTAQELSHRPPLRISQSKQIFSLEEPICSYPGKGPMVARTIRQYTMDQGISSPARWEARTILSLPYPLARTAELYVLFTTTWFLLDISTTHIRWAIMKLSTSLPQIFPELQAKLMSLILAVPSLLDLMRQLVGS